jgi:hydroquinone 1,2-dioxygenase/2,6-dichloro-p-hydroquinone 1,2-dioxygenase/glyoxalase family protein
MDAIGLGIVARRSTTKDADKEETEMENRIRSLHHITLCTATAQSDYDFFAKVIGQRFVKRTMLYDGKLPIYHLYFADEVGTPGTILTCFPMRQTGLKARKGTGQFSTITYSVPKNSLDYWRDHLGENGVRASRPQERFGYKYISFQHPGCEALEFEMLEDPNDQRKPWKSPYVPEQNAVRGFHSWTVAVRELPEMDAFMTQAWGLEKVGQDGSFVRYQMQGGGPAKYVDLLLQPDVPQGSWTFGEGAVHHGAFDVPDLQTQETVKLDVEGLGYTDFSDRKHRGYFESIYVRTPGGALFEAAKTIGFTVDEDIDHLGEDLKVSPQFEATKYELLKKMNDPLVTA